MNKKARNARIRRIRKRRHLAAYKGDPLIPVKPFSKFLKELIENESVSAMAARVGRDEAWLRRTAAQVQTGGGRVYKLIDIRVSTVEDVLFKLGYSIYEVYDWDDPALSTHVPRAPNGMGSRFGRRSADPAFDKDWDDFDSLMKTASEIAKGVPDLIGEYERRYALRKQARRSSSGGSRK